uniref:Uncharacterized protein n=1 Tax=Drosophila pseudoobscura pseudoobscura TaxID=46245 RepID=A0A0R3NWB4_DROPS
MAWGMGSVYLCLKKRHPKDKDAHNLQAGEVENDLELESIVEADQGLALEDAEEEEEDGDLTLVVNQVQLRLMLMMLSVLQLNLHKSKFASAELLNGTEQGLVAIALVQKPWIATGISVAGLKFSNHNLFYSTSRG